MIPMRTFTPMCKSEVKDFRKSMASGFLDTSDRRKNIEDEAKSIAETIKKNNGGKNPILGY